MNIDKFGIYKKMRQANPGIGLPKNIEDLINKRVFFQHTIRGQGIRIGLVTGVSFNKECIHIQTNITPQMYNIEWNVNNNWKIWTHKDWLEIQKIKFF